VERDSDSILREEMQTVLGEWLYGRLLKALRVGGDEVTVPDLYRGAIAGRYQWFMTARAVEFTQIELSYEGRVLVLLYSAGDLKELRDVLLPQIADYAVRNGCSALVGHGRAGWGRFAKDYGFEIQGERYVRHLPNNNKEEN
jgi:hypothetical protein